LALKKCDTDLVVHGIIVGGLSSLTADEKSVFTEYEVEVKHTRWVREGHQPRLPVVIIKPGGSLKLPEGLVTTVFDQLSDVHLGREYLLFLRAPKTPTDAYYLNDAQHPGVLEIDAGSISFTKRTPDVPVADWLKQVSLEALVNSSGWSIDTSPACAQIRPMLGNVTRILGRYRFRVSSRIP